jgi:sugar phosphate isomerase/epimerase
MRKNIPVALQLWSLKDEVNRDFATTASHVADIGYRYVELAGFGNLNPVQAQKALATAGLKAISAHFLLPRLRKEINQVIDEAKLFGFKQIVCPSLPTEALTSKQSCDLISKELQDIGAHLRSHQLTFAFHNHAKEFNVLDGRIALDLIFDAIAPKNLASQLDIYWVFFAKVDCNQCIRQLGRRIVSLHLKDGFLSEKGTRDTCEIGAGKVPFEQIFETIETIGCVENYVVEQEDFKSTPLESVKKSFEVLKGWNKV